MDDLEGMEVVAVLVNDAHGRYSYQVLTERFDFSDFFHPDFAPGDAIQDWQTLKEGPDGEYYYDAWIEVEENAVYRGPNKEWHGARLYQSGDIYLVRYTNE